VERSFGVLEKWRILHHIPRYSLEKQTWIIVARMALHNFIRENDAGDLDFTKYDSEQHYFLNDDEQENMGSGPSDDKAEQFDINMNKFRDELADALWASL